jgi:hypothetical protein
LGQYYWAEVTMPTEGQAHQEGDPHDEHGVVTWIPLVVSAIARRNRPDRVFREIDGTLAMK